MPTPAPSLADVLARREARAARHAELLAERHMPLVSATVVCPGEDKNPRWVADVMAEAERALTEQVREVQGWPVWWHERHDGPTGPELLLAVDADPAELKRVMVVLEEQHPWGRVWDLDVVSEDGDDRPLVLTREAVGRAPRRCLLCERPSPACARSRRHSVAQLQAAIARVVDGTVERVADAALTALLREARLSPKPGLVDAETAGAHRDMTLTTFERSAEALAWYLAACARAGAGGLGFDELVGLGVAAEQDMLAATRGVNTHRGAIYSLGLLCAAAGADPDAGFDGWCRAVAAWAGPRLDAWTGEVRAQGARSHGEEAFLALGLAGARGEAASGYATVRDVALPAYRDRLTARGSADDALRWALVAIMAAAGDTNVYARGGADAVAAVRSWAEGVLGRRPSPDELVALMREADVDFTARRWSPGGAADLLAVTIFALQLA